MHYYKDKVKLLWFKVLIVFFLWIEEINVCAVTYYMRNVIQGNISFNLNRKLSSFKGYKI